MPEEEKKIVIPTGFVEVTVDVTVSIARSYFMYTPAFVEIRDSEGNLWSKQSIPIGRTQAFPMPPGLFNVRAKLGGVASPPQNVEVKEGETTSVRILFGKQPQ